MQINSFKIPSHKWRWVLLNMMRSFIFLLCTTVFSLNTATTFSQEKIVINEDKLATVDEVFDIIKEQTNYKFIYLSDAFADAPKVQLRKGEILIKSLLEEILERANLNFELSADNTIVIKQKPSNQHPTTKPQDIKVSGKVTDEKGMPIPGVTVLIKGTNKGTVTDFDGSYNITVASPENVLVFSALGFAKQEITVGNNVEINVSLKESVEQLEEVEIVSTGYQDIPQERATGSFTKIDEEKLNEQVGTNILDRLDGVTSGILFDDTKVTSGNKRLNFSIRGVSTINGLMDPLIVVDNFPYEGDIDNINPNDVESITILKDAAAASIWGSRAGNGVVVITTKKGRFNQKLNVEFNSSLITSSKPDFSKVPQMSSSDYIDVEQFLFNQGYFNSTINSTAQLALTPAVQVFLDSQNGLITPADSTAQINALKKIDSRDQYEKYFYQNPITQRNSISLNGGSNNLAWYLFAGNDNSVSQTGSEANNLNIHFKNTYQATKNLQLSLGLKYTDSKSKSGKPGFGSIRAGGRQVPYVQFADENGNPLPVDISIRGTYTDAAEDMGLLNWKYYPLEDYKHDVTKTNLNNLLADLGVSYKIVPGLDINVNYQYGKQRVESRHLQDIESFAARNLINRFSQIDPNTGVVDYIVPLGSILNRSNSEIETKNFRGQLNFNRSWGKHNIAAIGGGEIRQTRTNSDANTTYGYNDDILTFGQVDYTNSYPTIINGSQQFIPNGQDFSGTLYRYVSYFINGAYIYNNKYTLSASARKDASNLFGVNPNDKWNPPFWSLGMGWEISKEGFYEKAGNGMPYLKLRATYGYSGNVDLSQSAYTVMSYQGSNGFTGLTQGLITQFSNPDLKWEKNSQLNVGLDFASKNQIVTGSFDIYWKKGEDLLGSSFIDYTAGLGQPSVTKNIASIKGKGIDLVLNTKNIQQENFTWVTNWLFSYNANEVTDYFSPSTITSSFLVSQGNGFSIGPLVGKSLYSIISYNWGGLDENGNPQGYVDGELSTDYNAIRNAEGDFGENGNVVYHGTATPEYFGAIGNTFRWKGFSLTANITYKLGYYFRKNTISYDNLITTGLGHSDYALRWQNPGDEVFTNVPSFIYPNINGRSNIYTQSEATVLRGDHIRLQYINLSYDLKDQLTFVKSLQIYVNASNLGLLWTKNKENIDPDNQLSATSVPPVKTFAIGIRGNF